jgi:hypothetical protein
MAFLKYFMTTSDSETTLYQTTGDESKEKTQNPLRHPTESHNEAATQIYGHCALTGEGMIDTVQKVQEQRPVLLGSLLASV